MRMRGFKPEMYIESGSRLMSPRLLLSCILIPAIQLFIVFSQFWFVFSIDLNKCLNCGKLIVTMGTHLEQSMEDYARDFETEHTKLTLNNLSSATGMNKEYIETSNEADVDTADTITLFTIQNYVQVYFGLWSASLCTEDVKHCVNIEISKTEVFDSMPLLAILKDTVTTARLWFLCSITVGLLSSLYITAEATLARSCSAKRVCISILCSAFLSFIGVIISCVPYLNMADFSDTVTFQLPWATVMTSFINYGIVAGAFKLWRMGKTLHRGPLICVLTNTNVRPFLKYHHSDIYNRENTSCQCFQKLVSGGQSSPEKKMCHYI